MLVVWAGAAIHRSKLVKVVLTASRGRLWLQRVPAYAPELNQVEYLWAHLKEHQIANLLVEHGWELSLHATRALRRMRRRPRIIRAAGFKWSFAFNVRQLARVRHLSGWAEKVSEEGVFLRADAYEGSERFGAM